MIDKTRLIKLITIGFTGTQKGMTSYQIEEVANLLREFCPVRVAHGDCIGSDAQFHNICNRVGVKNIVIHPPINSSKRAFCSGVILPEKNYLDRNHDIVDSTDIILATPGEYKEQIRSGTWATIRYARKKIKRIYIVYPSGEIEENKYEGVYL